ncbi:SDR family oxidoreductase [Burkholderia multivorans]|uniref:SDR family oxidoreductase n=1 Tax=Burkholderia multivorans TaxID=87883 RepID=UPI0021BFDBAA|nr:SDR family oxidoreductase [Burkholderia multivorans]
MTSKTVFITGASAGVGEETAKLFLDAGWNVIAAARRAPGNLGPWSHHPNVQAIRLDVTDVTSIKAAVDQAIDRWGTIDLLVNNAGVGVAGPVEAVSQEAFRALFETNFFGTLNTINAIVPHMRAQGDGVIVNVTSLVGRIAVPYLGPYVASKFAVEGLTETLQYELAPLGIRVKLVEPGGIRTEFRHRWFRHAAYDPDLTRVSQKIDSGGATALPPSGVARVILKAAGDRSQRLRYSANGSGALLFLNRILPESSIRSIMRKTFLKP